MPVLLAAAVLFFVALLPAGGRCQGMGAGGARDLALPPVPSWQSQVLLSRIHSLGRDLTDEVQRKYGFCMANVQNDFSQAFDFPDTTFVSDCMEQTRGFCTIVRDYSRN